MHFLLVLIALLAGGGGGDEEGAATALQAAGGGGLVAEPQDASGRFTTATEVRPILTATKANWVAVREYGGQDLVYVTHLLAWRCGLLRLEYGINDGPWQVFDLPPCHLESATPNALVPEDGLPYVGYPAGSVARVAVRVTYDDLGTDMIAVDRQGALIP